MILLTSLPDPGITTRRPFSDQAETNQTLNHMNSWRYFWKRIVDERLVVENLREQHSTLTRREKETSEGIIRIKTRSVSTAKRRGTSREIVGRRVVERKDWDRKGERGIRRGIVGQIRQKKSTRTLTTAHI